MKKFPNLEDNLCWKTTFGERRPAVEEDLEWKTTFVGFLHAAYSALWHFFTQCQWVTSLKIWITGQTKHRCLGGGSICFFERDAISSEWSNANFDEFWTFWNIKFFMSHTDIQYNFEEISPWVFSGPYISLTCKSFNWTWVRSLTILQVQLLVLIWF